MQLTPRYGADPLIVLEGPPAAIAVPAIRQRRRLAEELGSLTDDQWAHPSRCEGWSSRDVIVHLDSTNAFWGFAVAQGLLGEPTQFLATFDPVASPAELVAASDATPGEVLASFRASTGALCDLFESLDDGGWSAVAEAPPGHISVSALAHHALWDSWIHERDILLPLGVTPEVEDDEVVASLRYVAALSPAFALSRGADRRGSLAVSTTDPEGSFVVDVDGKVVVGQFSASMATAAEAQLDGGAVDLLEALSTRAPLGHAVPAESAWLLAGLAETFDVEPA